MATDKKETAADSAAATIAAPPTPLDTVLLDKSFEGLVPPKGEEGDKKRATINEILKKLGIDKISDENREIIKTILKMEQEKLDFTNKLLGRVKYDPRKALPEYIENLLAFVKHHDTGTEEKRQALEEVFGSAHLQTPEGLQRLKLSNTLASAFEIQGEVFSSVDGRIEPSNALVAKTSEFFEELDKKFLPFGAAGARLFGGTSFSDDIDKLPQHQQMAVAAVLKNIGIKNLDRSTINYVIQNAEKFAKNPKEYAENLKKCVDVMRGSGVSLGGYFLKDNIQRLMDLPPGRLSAVAGVLEGIKGHKDFDRGKGGDPDDIFNYIFDKIASNKNIDQKREKEHADALGNIFKIMKDNGVRLQQRPTSIWPTVVTNNVHDVLDMDTDQVLAMNKLLTDASKLKDFKKHPNDICAALSRNLVRVKGSPEAMAAYRSNVSDCMKTMSKYGIPLVTSKFDVLMGRDDNLDKLMLRQPHELKAANEIMEAFGKNLENDPKYSFDDIMENLSDIANEPGRKDLLLKVIQQMPAKGMPLGDYKNRRELLKLSTSELEELNTKLRTMSKSLAKKSDGILKDLISSVKGAVSSKPTSTVPSVPKQEVTRSTPMGSPSLIASRAAMAIEKAADAAGAYCDKVVERIIAPPSKVKSNEDTPEGVELHQMGGEGAKRN